MDMDVDGTALTGTGPVMQRTDSNMPGLHMHQQQSQPAQLMLAAFSQMRPSSRDCFEETPTVRACVE